MPALLRLIRNRLLSLLPLVLGVVLLGRAWELSRSVRQLTPWPDMEAGAVVQHVAGGITLLAACLAYGYIGRLPGRPMVRVLRAGTVILGSLMIATAVPLRHEVAFLIGCLVLILPLIWLVCEEMLPDRDTPGPA